MFCTKCGTDMRDASQCPYCTPQEMPARTIKLMGKGKHSIEVSEKGVTICVGKRNELFFPISEITTVELAKPSMMYPGLIRVSVAGSRNCALTVPTLAGSDADNNMRTVLFSKSDLNLAQEIRDYIVSLKQ